LLFLNSLDAEGFRIEKQSVVLDGLAHGIDRFEGLVLGENISSRRMLARGGAALRPDGGGVLAYRLPVRPRAAILLDSPLAAVVAAQTRRAGLNAGAAGAAARPSERMTGGLTPPLGLPRPRSLPGHDG